MSSITRSAERAASNDARLTITSSFRQARKNFSSFAAPIVMVFSGCVQADGCAVAGVECCKDSEVKLLKSQISEVEAPSYGINFHTFAAAPSSYKITQSFSVTRP